MKLYVTIIIYTISTIRLIKTRGPNNRNVTRDVFSCELSGFDQHFDLKASLEELYDQINQPLAGFRWDIWIGLFILCILAVWYY